MIVTLLEKMECASLGARNTKIKNPNSETKSLVLFSRKKLSENYRFAVFHHSNHHHDTPTNFTLRDETRFWEF